ncbi:exosortase/archaeosortase family protein [Candidatus Micrarchaeota archaeon]|nr:exosortase/archaeosortase family protein [Candidatus Micrarchaeota archaeon]MBU1930047.1 exosortase/archaeosortase family protein [Candidatus Micrarchaeota archaeon]
MKATEKEYQEVLNAGKFVLFLLIAFVALNLFTSLFPPLFFESITGQTNSALLNGMGISNQFQIGETVLIQLTKGPTIVINDLCTGILEAIVLLAAILATFEIYWKKRIVGVIAAIIGIFIFNQIRILVTTLFILNAPLEIVVLSHDVLFRLFLFIVIAVFYGAWLWWSYNKFKNRKKSKK